MAKKSNIPTTAVNFRIPNTALAKLDELCTFTNLTRGQVIIQLVLGEYDRINGNPTAKELLEKLTSLRVQLDEYTGNM